MQGDEIRRRFDELKRAEAQRTLTDTERAELRGLDAALDAEEARVLGAAAERMEEGTRDLAAEKARVEAATRELERIVEQQEKLAAEAHAYADGLRQRRAALTAQQVRLRGSHLHAR